MARATGIGDSMETEFSDPDDAPNAREDHALLTTPDQSPAGNKYFSMALEPEKFPQRGNAVEAPKKSLGLGAIGRYPKGVFFCLGNEFSERFSYYGMRAILTLYLITVHDMEPSNAKLLFHAFVSLAYFMPVFGSILADGFLGRYRVILYISLCYCVGHLLLTAGAVATVGSSAMIILDFSGLFIIALSTGGIKPCVSAFAADQFPERMYEERKQFFSFFYFSINLGALLSKIITPVLRRHHCLGEEHCFPLAFGIPAIFMFLATFVFWAGTRYFTFVPRTENVIVRVCQCVVYALRQRAKSESKSGKHWLDYARPKYSQTLIDDIKTIIRIVILYIPVIFFWSLFDQLGSTWVLQANDMNGRVGQLTLLPDQMPVLNPLLIIIFVPILEGVVYPVLSKFNCLVRPLRRMGWGGILAAVSFALAGFLQLQIDKTKVDLPAPGFGRLVMISCLDNEISLIGGTSNVTIAPHDSTRYSIDSSTNITIEFVDSNEKSASVSIQQGHGAFSVIFRPSTHPPLIKYDLKKASGGKTRLYSILEDDWTDEISHRSVAVMQNGKVKGEISNATLYADLEPDLWGSNIYEVYLKSCSIVATSEANSTCTLTFLQSYAAEIGAVDVIVLRSNRSIRVVELIPANTVSVLWQIPQYLVITVGEALFSITGLEFSYSEASPSMKSVLQAIWLLTTAFGNIIDMIISGSGMMKNNPAGEFFVYTALMTVVMFAFIVLAYRYKSASHGQRSQHDDAHAVTERVRSNASTKVLTQLD